MSVRTNLGSYVTERRTVLTEVDGEWVELFTQTSEPGAEVNTIEVLNQLRRHIAANTNEFGAKFRMETYRVQEVTITLTLAPWERT